ncbi:MAG: hypothetical protein WDN48_11395 [Pseudolabrys sp.]
MSAIFGLLRFDGGEASRRDLERMAKALAHRGPDGIQFIADGPLALGHGLMRVVREDAFEAQPLRDGDVTLVADLRLDNRDELAAAFGLADADLHDMPDSALLMRAYQKWGEDCARRLLGDFVFAIWDGRANKLVLGRDHMGQRYVHYHHGKDFFVFATDIKTLWSYPDVPRVLSDARIGQMLIHDRMPREGETLFDDILGLPGATVMTISAEGAVTKRRYWEPHADPVHENRDEAYYIGAYRRVLGEAVACRIRRTLKPPGLIFSGGYDSAAIAGLAGPVLEAASSSPRPRRCRPIIAAPSATRANGSICARATCRISTFVTSRAKARACCPVWSNRLPIMKCRRARITSSSASCWQRWPAPARRSSWTATAAIIPCTRAAKRRWRVFWRRSSFAVSSPNCAAICA